MSSAAAAAEEPTRRDLTEMDRMFTNLVRTVRAGASDADVARKARELVAEMTRRGVR